MHNDKNDQFFIGNKNIRIIISYKIRNKLLNIKLITIFTEKTKKNFNKI